MSLLDKPLGAFREADLLSLVADQIPENYTLEYKSSLSLQDTKDKWDFLGSLCAFANTGGGHLFIGIEAKDRIPVAVPGWIGANIDVEKQRFENLIQRHIEPRLPSHVFQEIRLANAETVLMVRVHRSWAAPHMVTINDMNRFYYRTSSGKAIMNVNQIRDAFGIAAGITERIAVLREGRLQQLRSRPPVNIGSATTALAVMHVVPFQAMAPGTSIDLEGVALGWSALLNPLGSGSSGSRFNLDGLLNWSFGRDGYCDGYTLLFRNGIVESVNRSMFRASSGRDFIPSGVLESSVVHKLHDIITLYSLFDVPSPIVLMLSLLNVEGYEFAIGGIDNPAMDRPDVLLPESIIQDVNQPPERTLKPVFDILWQAAGCPKCLHYDGETLGQI